MSLQPHLIALFAASTANVANVVSSAIVVYGVSSVFGVCACGR